MRKNALIERSELAVAAGFCFLLALVFSPGVVSGDDNNDIWDFDRDAAPEPAEVEAAPEAEEPEEHEVAEDPEVEVDEPDDVEVDEDAPEHERLSREEEVRRQEQLERAKDLQRRANRNLRDNEFQEAIDKYQEAKEILQNVSRVDEDVRNRIDATERSVGDAYNQWVQTIKREAREAADVARWDDAQDVLSEAAETLPGRADEFNRMAERLEEQRRDIEFQTRTRPEDVDPEKEEREFDIDVLKEQAKILYENGRYMEAKEQFEEVLDRDPYSLVAVRYLRRIAEKVDDKGEERRIATREEMLAETTWTWSQPVKPLEREEEMVEPGRPVEREAPPDAAIRQKLREIIIPRVEFEEATIHQVVGYLQRQSRELDPDDEGVNFVLNLADDPDAAPRLERRPDRDDFDDFDDFDEPEEVQDIGALTLNMENVPLGDVIRFVAMSAGLHYVIDPRAVIISDRELPAGEMYTRFFSITPGIFRRERTDDRDDDDPWGMDTDIAEREEVSPDDVKAYFRDLGVSFPEGSSIRYDTRTGRLVVYNTAENIQRIEELIPELAATPTQVMIEAKFVEVSQNALQEMGMQWAIAQGHTAYESSSGSRRLDIDASDLTTGVRTVSDALPTGATGDFLSAAAVLGNLELDVVLNALERSDKADILSAPKVTTISGEPAAMRIVTERYFPIDWNEPELTFDDDGQIQSVIPSTPVFGDAEEMGVILEVTPEVEPDNYTINLQLTPQVVEFLGYDTELDTVDPGTGVSYRASMPIIERRRVDAQVLVYDSETVVLGGMIGEELFEFEDKVPILGDIPLLGRLFRSRGKQSEKRNLLIFVTAHLVDPSGQPVRDQPLPGVPDFRR